MSSKVSYRRSLLDKLLNEHLPQMRGIIVDVGGEQNNQRGLFHHPKNSKENTWYSVNINPDTAPHIYGDAHSLPLSSNSVDCILCCEVLEHIKDPRQCCDEIWRVLKPGGVVFISVPFLFSIHADPDDYQRFTPSGLKVLMGNFISANILPMGGSLGTLGELIVQAGNSLENNILIRRIVKLIGRMMIEVEKRTDTSKFKSALSTGYFLKAYKP